MLQEVLDALLAGLPSALPAAKRHRLRCLRCVVVLLQSPGAPSIQTQAADPSSSPQDGVQQVRACSMRCLGHVEVKDARADAKSAVLGHCLLHDSHEEPQAWRLEGICPHQGRSLIMYALVGSAQTIQAGFTWWAWAHSQAT